LLTVNLSDGGLDFRDIDVYAMRVGGLLEPEREREGLLRDVGLSGPSTIGC
jgi:hypothetical protein